MTYDREQAWALLTRYNKEPFHLRHALTVEAVMGWYARALGYETEAPFWSMVGLLHDLDFEHWPEEHCTKAKELLAYLVDRRGSSVTTGEAYAALFEDAEDTPSGKSYFRTILHELIAALKKAQAEEILVKGHNSFAVDPETFDCDYYRFLQGDPAAVNAFQNDYMQSYSWAEIRNAELDFWEYREPERR